MQRRQREESARLDRLTTQARQSIYAIQKINKRRYGILVETSVNCAIPARYMTLMENEQHHSYTSAIERIKELTGKR